MAKADWARGPVQFLMTKEEQTAWNSVKSDAEADQFIALFWARRDPTPATAQNEFRDEFDRRVGYADQNFGTGRQRGSLTDRGKILVLFGAPTRATRIPARSPMQPPSDTTSTAVGTEAEEAGEKQTWIYEGPTAEKMFGQPKVEIQFVDRMNNKDLRLQPPRGIDFAAAQQRAVTGYITQPSLTSVPTYQSQPAPQPPLINVPIERLPPPIGLNTKRQQPTNLPLSNPQPNIRLPHPGPTTVDPGPTSYLGTIGPPRHGIEFQPDGAAAVGIRF